MLELEAEKKRTSFSDQLYVLTAMAGKSSSLGVELHLYIYF